MPGPSDAVPASPARFFTRFPRRRSWRGRAAMLSHRMPRRSFFENALLRRGAGQTAAPQFITCPHEELAVAMADGYYKSPAGPVSSVCTARSDCSPPRWRTTGTATTCRSLSSRSTSSRSPVSINTAAFCVTSAERRHNIAARAEFLLAQRQWQTLLNAAICWDRARSDRYNVRRTALQQACKGSRTRTFMRPEGACD